jgi:hypothetical protein
VALGVALHLLRDLPTGGAPLLWPLARWPVGYPYPVYLCLLLAAAVMPAVVPAVAGQAAEAER